MVIRYVDVAPPAKPRPAKRLIAAAREALAVAEAGTKPLGTKPKGGRPRQIEGEPWVAEGVSRRTWFRQQKAKAR